MSDLKYTEDHEWIRAEGDGTATVGITAFAQEQLGDVVFVELPEIGSEIAQGAEACVVESVKAAADVKMPAGGTVVEVNTRLGEEPELVNREPTGSGWFVKVRLRDAGELDALMDESEYQALIAAQAE